MAEESNTLRLYNSLRDNGYKLPEYDRFEGRLKDSAARETLYNTLRDNGVNDLPEFSAFETWLGYPMPEDLKEDSSQLPAASEEQILQQPPQNPAKQQTGFLGTFVGDVLERINAGGAELGAGIFGVLDKGAKGLENLTGGLIQSKGAWRDVADKFKQDATVSRANSNRYDGKSYSDLWKEGDYLGAIGDIALTGAESIPMSIAAAAASVANPAAGLVGIGGITASERYDELSEENPNMAEFPKIANAILTGVAEGGSEMLGAGATNLWMQGLYKTLGRERAEQAVKEGFMGKLRQHFKDFGIFYEPVVEGLEEVSSQLAQNVTDKITGAAPDKDISEGLMDSFIYGMGGGAYFSAAGVPGFIKQRVERRKALQAGKEMPESDYNSAYQSSEQSRQSLSDIDPNLAATIDRYVNDESSPGEVQSLFDGLDETVRPLAEAYYQSQLVMRGITERNLDDAESEVQAFADRIAPFAVPQDDGRRLITTAHFSEGLTEKDVYVSAINGDKAVIFTDDGSTRMVSAKRLQNIQEQDADDLIARYKEGVLNSKNSQMEFRLHHHPKTQPAQPGLVIFNGDKAYILQERDERGDWVAFPAVLDTETGQTTAKKGGEPSILTDAEVLELQDLMYAAQEPENQANEETEKTPNISAKTPNVSDETLGEISGTSGAVQNLLDVDANQPKTENATSSRIPMDAEGNPQYHLADINDTLDDLLDGSLSIEEVDGLVSANRKDAEKRLADIDKKRPSIGRSKAEYLRQRADWQATRDEVQQELDYWNEVDNQLKESRQQSGEDAALAVLKNQTPQTGEELAAEMLADGSIKLLRDDYMRETGGGRGEARGLFGLFAGRDKGGLTVEQAGEILMQADLEQGTNLFDQTDPNAGRNAIIDVLSEARTRGDLINYVRRSREEQARRAAEAEYNEYARWCEENFGMSPEDYEAYIEATERDFRGKMQTPEAFAIVDGEIYDAMLAEQQEYADIDAILEQSNEIENEDTERNDEGRGSSLREGGGEILPGTQPVEAGGTGDVEGIRQAGSDVDSADGTAQAEGRGEIDENGHPFVLASDGTTVFGQITANTGLAEAPIKLSEGFQSEDGKGYGLAHIENRHGNQIRNAGFSSIEDFVETVAKNFSIIRKGNDRGKNETFLLEVQDKHNNTLFIELSKDGSYWNVNSAGVFKKSYSKKKDVVWTLPAVGSSTSADATEVNNGTIEGATVTSGDSSQTTSSEGKDTDIPAQNQVSAPEFIPGESFFDMAERQKAANDRRAEEQKVDTNPTPAQKEAGNYKKGHIKLDGFDITIENPKGSTRSGVDANGNPWSITMNNTYGYIRGTEGVDGDHIDVFLSDDPTQGDVFVIDQVKADGTFDEHKVMYGFPSEKAAREAYLANYSPGWQGLGNITQVSKEEFKKWVDSSKRKTKPFAKYKNVNGNIRFRISKDDVSDFARRYNLNEPDVRAYADYMEQENLNGAARAFLEIRRKVRMDNRSLSFGQFTKVFSPIKKDLYNNFGNVDELREQYVQAEMEERNMMEAARRRAEEEAAAERKRLQVFHDMTDEQLDKEYFNAVKSNDENRMRDLVNEAAFRNGYGDAGSEYQGVGAWSAPSNPGYESDEARHSAMETDSPDVNVIDLAQGYTPQPDDYFTNLRAYGTNTSYGQESAKAINSAIDKARRGEDPIVKVFRAVPKSVKEGKLRNGDWVTPSRKYAEMHGNNRLEGDFRIIEQEVPASQLWWDGNDINEWGFDDGKNYVYRNTRNNRKLNNLITRDDKGNIIPLSQRFNTKKTDIRFRFIGERGAANLDRAEEATTRMDNLSVARDMENAFNEKQARIEKLRESKPVEITGEEYKGKYELKRDSAKAWIKDNLRGEYTINDTNETVAIGRKGINKVTSHSMGNEAHLKSLIAVPDIIQNAIFITEEVAEKKNAQYPKYRYYVVGLKIGGEDYTVKVTIGVDENGNKYYDHALTEIEKGTLIDNLNGTNPVADNQNANGFISTGAEPNPSVTDSKDTKLRTILQTNDRENARKIKMATGWERGADGKWRYETPDIEFTLPENIEENKDYKLTDFVKDDELFKAYPHMKDYKVRFENQPDEYGGGWYGGRMIVINTAYNNPEHYKTTFVHEIQHGIQAHEGFESGDHPDAVIDRYLDAQSDIETADTGTLNAAAFIRKKAERLVKNGQY